MPPGPSPRAGVGAGAVSAVNGETAAAPFSGAKPSAAGAVLVEITGTFKRAAVASGKASGGRCAFATARTGEPGAAAGGRGGAATAATAVVGAACPRAAW